MILPIRSVNTLAASYGSGLVGSQMIVEDSPGEGSKPGKDCVVACHLTLTQHISVSLPRIETCSCQPVSTLVAIRE